MFTRPGRLPVVPIVVFACYSFSLYAQGPCCNASACRAEAMAFANDFNAIATLLGPCPEHPPSIQDLLRAENDSLGWWDKKQLKLLHDKVVAYRNQSTNFDECVLSFIDDLNVVEWFVHFNSAETGKPSLPSPNFAKGLGVYTTLNITGVSDLYQPSERFSSLYGIHLGHVFGRRNPAKSPRFRWLVGGTMLYQGNETWFFLSPKLEYRLRDILFSPANLGAWKIHVQGHVGEDGIFMVDAGLGLETYIVSINLITVGYQDYPGDYYIHGGLSANCVQLVEMIKHKRRFKKNQ